MDYVEQIRNPVNPNLAFRLCLEEAFILLIPIQSVVSRERYGVMPTRVYISNHFLTRHCKLTLTGNQQALQVSTLVSRRRLSHVARVQVVTSFEKCHHGFLGVTQEETGGGEIQ